MVIMKMRLKNSLSGFVVWCGWVGLCGSMVWSWKWEEEVFVVIVKG